ncbi:hypothetical protein C2845_PM07G00880 [Panicum miliaceum]|uniref:Leucine-rich repeat-containing N-terminal plant-type domain-containing protein n=1 Tax=Panicum miliaceum TaxID=4540 RepID=A0A3L6SRA1_PANMI|nr:hypothetical protein C2845_PM07G00880 [Panicum miliaceum]
MYLCSVFRFGHHFGTRCHAGEFTTSNHTAVPVACLPDQASALLRLKGSFTASSSSISAFRSWRVGTDCCRWVGVQCGDSDGRVTSLDLGECGLESSGLDPALFRLSSLKHLNLAYNDFNESQLPSSGFERLVRLTHLNLSTCSFCGPVPEGIGSLTNLVTLDLSTNYEVIDLLWDGYYPSLHSSTDYVLDEQNLENLIHNLSNLRELHLGVVDLSNNGVQWCNALATRCPELQIQQPSRGFYGGLPSSSIGNLKSLSALEISGMGLVGQIPSWAANLTSLTILRFYDCGLSGLIPSFIGALRYLRELVLGSCMFSGEIPPHISNLTQLQILLLYSNNFVGNIELSFVANMPNLIALDLSRNNLVVTDGEYNSSLTSLPKIKVLALQNCSMSKFPNFLRGQDDIYWLDLSKNEIEGAIPHWFWETWNDIMFMDLSTNRFTSVGYTSSLLPIHIDKLFLDNNMFEGYIPIPKGSATVLEYSNNMFSSVPSKFSSHLAVVVLFKASNNNLYGEIPLSFCGGTSIQILDLSYNNFTGSIPSCLMENVNGLGSLSLKENKLSGEFPDSIKEGCSFAALDFSGNWIEGKLPRSLLACKNLEVLDVGNNQISDSFPCWMSTLHELEVLVLKSNKFSGQLAQSLADEKSKCAFPRATIIDLSSNNFLGPLPQHQWFQELKSMAFRDPNTSLVMQHELPNSGIYAYEYTAAVTYKGRDTNFAKILRTLVSIDFSNNAFHGSIPQAIGQLGLLHGLNISHNFLTGPIPSQLGQLRQLEALDLSFNKLSGEIPQELTSLDFLTTLNLSNNKLVGSIPMSPHFQTFLNSSFVGNDGLCGSPLSKGCINTTTPKVWSHHSRKKSTDLMTFLFVGLGFGFGFATAIVVAWGIPIRKRS